MSIAKWIVTNQVEGVLRSRYDSAVMGRLTEIAAELGWPKWAVKIAARRLGLTRSSPRDRHEWADPSEPTLALQLDGDAQSRYQAIAQRARPWRQTD